MGPAMGLPEASQPNSELIPLQAFRYVRRSLAAGLGLEIFFLGGLCLLVFLQIGRAGSLHQTILAVGLGLILEILVALVYSVRVGFRQVPTGLELQRHAITLIRRAPFSRQEVRNSFAWDGVRIIDTSSHGRTSTTLEFSGAAALIGRNRVWLPQRDQQRFTEFVARNGLRLGSAST
jgi:hypothetical protein